MSATAIAPRATRLADLPAAPLLALVDLIPKTGPMSALRIAPSGTEGRVRLELASPTAIAALELDGDAERVLFLPGWMLRGVHRRHRDAARLVVDAVEPGGIALRSFGTDATVSQVGPEGSELPALPELDLDGPRVAGDRLPLLMDPRLIAKGLAVASRLGIAPARLRLLDHPLIGMALDLQAVGSGEVAGSLALARCSMPSAR